MSVNGLVTNLNYIPDDGYTEAAYIAPVDRLFGEFRFKFRPMLLHDRSRIIGAVASMPHEKRNVTWASEAAKRIIDWSHSDATGQPIPVTAAAMLRIKPQLQERIVNIVAGFEAADSDPESSPDDKAAHDEADVLLTAISEGRCPGDVREERDAKN